MKVRHSINRSFFHIMLSTVFTLACSTSYAYTVTQLAATYRNGQVFITWKCPAATDLKYHVYQATKPILTKKKISNSTYLGYVRDNSSRNERKSLFYQQDIYFKIDPAAGPLASDDGLFVTTCATTKKYYYAIVVENTLTGIADTSLVSGINTLAVPVKNKLADTQPVLQQTIVTQQGDNSYEYVSWGNSIATPKQPAFNNCGSFGYNFTYVEHTTGSAGLVLNYRDGDPFTPFTPENCTDCNGLLLDDWLPNGENSYWYGYHEDYDMYTFTNPVFDEGIVKSYTQNRVKWTLDWINNNKNIDTTRIYATGISHNGFGPLLTGVMYPQSLAAVWVTVAPPFIRAFPGTPREMQWGGYYDSLMTDVPDPNDGQSLMIWDLFDMRVMYRINNHVGIPYMGGVHGKNDATLGWVQYYFWYDSLEVSNQGGLWFWDQRKHNGNNKNFTDSEAYIDFDRFYTDRSYPAFSYCSINQDWGNGIPSSGDPYGAYNGYPDWEDASILDTDTSYSIRCFIKDMTVGGVPMPVYNSCTTDLTLRRLQHFDPQPGQQINYTVYSELGQLLNSGTLVYDGSPVTVHEITIEHDGSTLSLQIADPLKQDRSVVANSNVPFITIEDTGDGYLAQIVSPEAAEATLQISDMQGRQLWIKNVLMQKGLNTVPLQSTPGLKMFTASTGTFLFTEKLLFRIR